MSAVTAPPTLVWRQGFSIEPNHMAAYDPTVLHAAVNALIPAAFTQTSDTKISRSQNAVLFAAARTHPVHQRNRVPVAPMGRAASVLVQSLTPLTGAPRTGALRPLGDPFTVPLDYQAGQVLDFRLIAHPQRALLASRDETGKRSRGRRITIAHPDHIFTWLSDKLTDAAHLHPGARIGRRERCYTAKSVPELREIHGRLTVADPAAFTELVVHGIGRDRSYGAGLMLTRPSQH